MVNEEVLLKELTRHANMVGRMEATLQALQAILAQPMCEPNRWYALSMINSRLEDAKTVQPAAQWSTRVEAKPDGLDQKPLPLPAPKSTAERRREIMDRATKVLRLPG